MSRGIIVSGTGFFEGDGTVWRARLIEIIVRAIHGFEKVPEGLPVFVSLPSEPLLQQPRGFAVVQIDIYQYDWPTAGTIERHKLGDLVCGAIEKWFAGCRTQGSQALACPPGVIVNVTTTSGTPCARPLAK